jgi:hypothetical protein
MERPSGENPEASIDTEANAKFEYHLSRICIARGERQSDVGRIGRSAYSDQTLILIDSKTETMSGRLLKFNPQAKLPRTVSAILRGLNALGHARRGRLDVRWWRREVRMIQQVRKRTFKPQTHSLREMEVFGESCRDSGRDMDISRAL